MLKGVKCKLLRINLSDKSYREEVIPDEYFVKFIGSGGLAIKYLYDELEPGIDPLGPENKLIFAVGPITGSKAIYSSRCSLTSKSPATGTIGVATAGGYFPTELKMLGYDMIIIEGKAEEPTYLYIKDGKVQFKPAAVIWGSKTPDAMRLMKQELHDEDIKSAVIGPAGENLSNLAGVFCDDMMRAFARRGFGAVMGSKNLKGVALHAANKQEVEVADPETFNDLVKQTVKTFSENPFCQGFKASGTLVGSDGYQVRGVYPSKNWQTSGIPDYVDYVGEKPHSELNVGKEGCYRCPMTCAQLKLVKNGKYAGAMSVVEYESMFALGGEVGNKDIGAQIAADRLCDELGLDTVSTGVSIGWAMECYEKGIFTKEDTFGLDLHFGNADALIQLIHDIAYKEGLGALLTDGVKIASKKVGKGSEYFAIQSKGLEHAAYDVRGMKSMALSMATCFTGGDHNKCYTPPENFGMCDRFSYEGKPEMTIYTQNYGTAVADCAGTCNFPAFLGVYGEDMTTNMVNAITGIGYTKESYMECGARVTMLARMFNVREGLRRINDDLPERHFNDPIAGGEAEGQFLDKDKFNEMLDKYYEMRGCTPDGVPTKEGMDAIDLSAEYANMIKYVK